MKCFIAGGAGFVGQNLVKVLERAGHECRIYDKKVAHHGSGVCADIQDVELLTSYMSGFDIVFHLASNADIAKAAIDPTIDFIEGTQLTQKILEAMRINGIKRIVYFSGSGVYGDNFNFWPFAESSTLTPVSPYGASKMASEAMICAYCHMFGMNARVFRPGNIVGGGQTHGVGYDFIHRLRSDPTKLRVLGNGRQAKTYIHIDDILSAVMLVTFASINKVFTVLNVATQDLLTVRQIAHMAIEVTGAMDCRTEYGPEDRGWNGDVPRVQLNCTRLRDMGWNPAMSSIEAMRSALISLNQEYETNTHPSGPH